MDVSPSFFDLHGLQEAENTYRQALRAQPDNMALRLSLAWCLFMQAVHQSGHETALTNAADVHNQAVVSYPSNGCRARNSQALLRDCLHQTYTIKHLSTQNEVHQQVESLQALVELTGAQEMAIVAEKQSMEKLVRLASAVSRSAEADSH